MALHSSLLLHRVSSYWAGQSLSKMDASSCRARVPSTPAACQCHTSD
jgi:hypothetical protein